MLDYLERLSELRSIDEVWAHHVKRMAGYGFDRLLYGFTRDRRENSLGDRKDWLLLSNHSDEYIKKFIDEDMFFDAPMVNWVFENVGTCSWSWVQENHHRLSEAERRVVRYNARMGIEAGYSISFKDVSRRAKGGIGLVAERGVSQKEVDALWREKGREIVQMNNVAHLKMTTLPYDTLRRPLTKRQREALEWVGDGKTTQDIATIMGLTPVTIEKHLRLARDALNVETTAQAVLKASYQNQIFLLRN